MGKKEVNETPHPTAWDLVRRTDRERTLGRV